MDGDVGVDIFKKEKGFMKSVGDKNLKLSQKKSSVLIFPTGKYSLDGGLTNS